MVFLPNWLFFSVCGRSKSVGRGRFLATDLKVDLDRPTENDFFSDFFRKNGRKLTIFFVKLTIFFVKLQPNYYCTYMEVKNSQLGLEINFVKCVKSSFLHDHRVQKYYEMGSRSKNFVKSTTYLFTDRFFSKNDHSYLTEKMLIFP